ncbi:glycosyltransferase family 4 protein [Candidatus Uhrbacteria bacterium]|nr:glycosyltransferase family 4 protein [Candidatus Uhrbacteria bacterium]
MKIAIVTPVLGSAGGMGHVVEEHATRLAARGHEVTVFVPTRQTASTPPAFRVQEVKPRLRYNHGAWVPDLARMVGEFPFVHLHYPFLGGTGSVLKWRRATRTGKLVVTYHMDLIGRGILRPLFRAYQKRTLPGVARTADRLTVSSFDYAEHGDANVFLSRYREKVVELPFGVDTDRFAPREADAALLRELGIGEDESVILFVGRLDRAHYFKGIAVLLRACAELAKEAARIRLVLVGSGDRLKHYKGRAARLKLGTGVIFAPGVSDQALARYYSIADVLVLPSTDRSEALGLVLLEAQASGVPVIASDLPGVRTALEDQTTGFLVTPRDVEMLWKALAWILTHPEEHEAMRRAARARIEAQYRWDPIIDRLEGIYRDVSS